MDDLTLMRSFRAERVTGVPESRAEIWRMLEERFDSDTVAPGHARLRNFPRRRLLTLAGAGVTAAIVAGVLVLNSGPSAEPVVAEVLHETAAVAASGEDAPALQAGPGQYYFTQRKEVEFMGWYPGSYSIVGGPATRPNGFSALIPRETEYWLSPEGGFRARETLSTPRFLSGAEQNRWEEAGSPLPKGFEPRYEPFQEEAGGQVYKHGRGVLEVEAPRPQLSPHNFPDLSKAPTDPKQLRLAIRTGQASGISKPWGTPVGMDMAIESLTSILSQPNAGPELRAAAFNALAELPGFELDHDASDLLGRHGYAISYDQEINGNREEVIIDPDTSALLGERSILTAASLQEPQWKGYEAGLTLRDVAYLASKVVNSTDGTGAETEAGQPVATAGKDNRN